MCSTLQGVVQVTVCLSRLLALLRRFMGLALLRPRLFLWVLARGEGEVVVCSLAGGRSWASVVVDVLVLCRRCVVASCSDRS